MSEKYANHVEKYIEKFGEAWEARATGIIDKVVAAVETRDFGDSRQLFYVKQNPFNRELSAALIGIQQPITQSRRIQDSGDFRHYRKNLKSERIIVGVVFSQGNLIFKLSKLRLGV